jgi:hypothetical protein
VEHRPTQILDAQIDLHGLGQAVESVETVRELAVLEPSVERDAVTTVR